MYYYHLCQCKGFNKYHTNYANFLDVNFRRRKDWKLTQNKDKADYCDCPKLKNPKIEDRFLSLAWFTKKKYLAKILADTNFYPTTYQKLGGKLYSMNDSKNAIQINDEKGKWFIKPNFDHSGNQIQVSSSLSKAFGNAKDSMIIQRGIEPKLIRGRKFDLRLYALGVVDNGNINFYLYKNGYCRLSSKKYDKTKLDRNSNLTNICVHIKIANPKNIFIMYKDWNGYPDTFPEITNISTELFRRMGKDLDKNYRGIIVMGLDVMIDEEGKPWILEINNKLGSKLSPYSKKFRDIHNRMYNQMMNLLFPGSGKTDNWQFLVRT